MSELGALALGQAPGTTEYAPDPALTSPRSRSTMTSPTLRSSQPPGAAKTVAHNSPPRPAPSDLINTDLPVPPAEPADDNKAARS